MKRTMLLASLLWAFLTSGLPAQTQDNSALEEFKAQQRARITRQRTYLGSSVQIGPCSWVSLLQKPAVQEELHLTSSQKTQIKELFNTRAQSMDKYNKFVRESHTGNIVDPEKKAEVISKAEGSFLSASAAAERDVGKPLDASQRGRLSEIQLQSEGPFAFTRPDIIKRLIIDPDRAEAIKGIIAEAREEQIRVSALPPQMEHAYFNRSDPAHLTQPSTKAFQSEVEKAREAALKVRAKTMQTIAKLLTKNQRKKFDKMLGEPFDLAKLRTPPAVARPADSKDKPGNR